jgi:hypothetical protein
VTAPVNAPVRLDPAPGYTIPGVGVPGAPTEQQATQAAVDYGWLIAVVLIGGVLLAAVRYVTKRIDFRLVLVLTLLGIGAYQYGKVKGS